MRLNTPATALSLLLLTALASCNTAPTGQSGSLSNDAALERTQSEQPADAGQATSSSASEQTASASDGDKATPDDSKEDAKAIPDPIYPALSPGQYCYSLSTKTESIEIVERPLRWLKSYQLRQKMNITIISFVTAIS